MQTPNPLDPHTALGAVKARPSSAGASREVTATAGLDRPCTRRVRPCAGRGEGTALGTNKGTTQDEKHAMT